jgi:hypothetical protein
VIDERMGHAEGSVQARYSHVTAAMRRQLNGCPDRVVGGGAGRTTGVGSGSPVAVLDRLLTDREGKPLG